ncbi:MAG: adenylate cyclase [Chthoniobacter sp.]|nr:adenylate cyclase [Chthoniobacter sp.]
MAAICALCTTAVLALHFTSTPFQQAEMRGLDALVRFASRSAVDPRLVYLAIDDASINFGSNAFSGELAASPALQKIAAGWPWSREVHAMIVDRLLQAGARVVALDLLFPTPREGDEALRAALDRWRDRVVIGSNFVDEDGAGATRTLSVPTSSLVENGASDDRVGFVNFWPNPLDDVVRAARYRVSASEIFHTAPVQGEAQFESLSARVLRKIGLADKIPTGPKTLRFASAADRGGFRPLSAYLLFVPEAWKENFQNGEFFRDKIVVVGPCGNFLKDQLPTPLGLMEGPEVHLNALNEALQSSFVTRPGPLAEALIIAAAGLAALALSLAVSQPIIRFVVLVAGSAAYLGAVALLYDHGRFLAPLLAPLFAFDLSGVTAFIWQQWLERRESRRVRRIFERFVSRNVVSEVVDNRESFLLQLGGVRKCVVVLMTDLRGFTSLTEQADSTQLVAQLNEYFTEMVKCVFAADGTLDKFIGDAVLAVWGNVHSDGPARDAELAVTTALRMQKSLRELNAEWPARGWVPLQMGIGINYGEVIFAALGSEEKAEPTVIGDPVNVASRLEGLTKEYGLDLIIGESVAELIREKFHLQVVDLVRPKGKTRAVRIYTVLGRVDEKLDPVTVEYLREYDAACAQYHVGEFGEAGRLFEAALAKSKGDPLAPMYAARCQRLLHQPPAAPWDGVYVMETK